MSRSSSSARSSRCRRTTSTCGPRSNRSCARSQIRVREKPLNFVWRDAGRTVVFEAGGVEAAPKLLAEHGIEPFELLTTSRHLDAGAALADAAIAVHELPPADPATAV